MSLQVWLPLNGDLKNQGLCGNLNISAINTLTFVDGKIGKCYQRATDATQITTGINIDNNLLDILGTKASVAVWVKPLGSHTHYNGTLLSSGNWNAKRWAFGVSQDNSKVDVLCGGYNTYIDCSVPVNQWTHLCSTFNNGVSKLYKNGVYIGQLTGRANFDSDATNTCIGRETYASGYFGFNGLINDMRIYDHVLSDKEVEELAKGLVLHYKLDNNGLSGNNLALHTHDLSIGSSKTNLNMYVRGSSIRQLRSDGFYESKGTASWHGLSFWANQLNLTPGTKITYSFYIYGNGSSRAFSFYPMMYNSAGTRDTTTGLPISIDGGPYTTANAKAFANTTATTPEYHYVTFEWNQAVTNIINDGGSIELSIQVHGTWNNGDWACIFAPKVEIGEFPTPWSPAPSEIGNINIIYDSSGYNNNGIITGTINTNSNTSRYNVGSSMNNTSTSNHIECINQITLPTDGITASIWVKALKTQSHVIFAHPQIEFGTLNSLGYCHPNSNQAGWTLNNFINNEWNHIAVVRQNTTYQLYINGVLETQNGASNNYNHNKNVLWLLNRGNNNTYAANASISDFRIYATALTEEQVLELYHTSGTIDHEGNFYAREFDENDNLNLTKTGIFGASNIYDNDELTKASILKTDKQVQGNTLYEY